MFNAQALQVEAWKAAHDEAMQCAEIEDAIQLGLMILANIRRHNEQWAREIDAAQTAFAWRDAERFAELYRWWRDRSEPLVDGIAACEAAGFSVTGSADFRDACRDVDLMSLGTDRVQASIESLNQGRRISFQQAMNGLRNSLR